MKSRSNNIFAKQHSSSRQDNASDTGPGGSGGGGGGKVKWIKTKEIEIRSLADAELGAGSFGVVRKGYYQGKAVAVKCLKMEDAAPEKEFDSIELFIAEAKIMRDLIHPRIVSFVGFILESTSCRFLIQC